MPFELLLSLTGLAAAITITPGPNNFLVAASGANFGYRRTIPHILGIVSGFPIMLLLSNTGLSWVFKEHWAFLEALKYLGGAYILFLAWKLMKSCDFDNPPEHIRPMYFIEACMMQWVNPKAWILAMATASTLAGQTTSLWVSLGSTLALFATIAFLSVSVWCLLGQQLQKYLHSNRAKKLFNLAMAQLLMACAAVLVLL